MRLKKLLLLVFLSFQTLANAQLGFCTGSKGAPIFFENFGSGLDYGPPLTVGTTSYTYVNSGFPQDGQYTLFHRTNLIPNSQNWLFSLDHTPDTDTNGLNGKCLIVNADLNPNQFFRRTVTGLCSNTTFEFSAWVLNILNATTNQQPINVAFEIWDSTDTTLLKTGSTGVIPNTFTPIWNQYGMVFTLPAGQNSVILKIRNNFSGGLGNDLALDDIMFRACGDSSFITNIGNSQNSISICENETITNNILEVTTLGTAFYVYQWQESNDNVNFTDITGQSATTYTIPALSQTTYYRVKIANDITNLNNSFCSIITNPFGVFINSLPDAPISGRDKTLCSNQTTTLSVTVNANQSVNWYDSPTNGNLLQANSSTFSPTNPGTYYAEAYNLSTACKSNTRTDVTLIPMITATSSGTTTICSGETTAINLTSSDTNATFNWTASSTSAQGFSNGTGTTIAQTLTNTGITTGTVTYIITPVKDGCEGMPLLIMVSVNAASIVTLTFPIIPNTFCLNAVAPILPNASSNTIPINGTWSPASIDTSIAGTTNYLFTPQITSCQNIQPFHITIEVGNSFTPNFENTLTICFGQNSPNLNTTSPNGIVGTWKPSVINNKISDSYVFTPNIDQCADNQTLDVTILESNLSYITYTTSETFSENQVLTITAFDSGDYLYQLDNDAWQENAVFQNVSSGIHSIKVIDKTGCSVSITKQIMIVGYPKAFTPNNDGFNDYWNISEFNNFQNSTISIFDRYGKLLKQFSGKSSGWDGTYNNINLPADDYWFTINFEENTVQKLFKSHFSLKR